MASILYEQDADLKHLKGSNIVVIGYGNQGRAHALNLRDSGLNVSVAARTGGKSFDQAIADKFKPLTLKEASRIADVIVITLPDEHIASIYNSEIKESAKQNATFVFAHGFAVHYKTIQFPESADIILVAPTGPGRQVRSLYEEGKGLPSLIAIEQNKSGFAREKCLAYAKGIGSTRAGVIETTFKEETIVDLFCEQSVLCGGVPELIKSSFQTLVDKGYQPELAYISCLKEVKLIADLLFDRGLDGMRTAISNTAKYGAAISGPEIVDSRTASTLDKVLTRIEDGSFAKTFLQDADNPDNLANMQQKEEKNSKLNKTGKQLKETLIF